MSFLSDGDCNETPSLLRPSAPDTQVAAYLAVVESRGQVVFVVRPTINDANWSTNCNYTTVPTDLVEGGMVHGGFHHAWSEISDDVLSNLEQVAENFPGFEFISIGHSLGGAVAAVAAAHLRALGYNVDIYTYGAPRIGNDILSDFISNQGGSIYRVTHNDDPIPRVPLATGDVFGGQYKYRHVSPEYWLTGKPEDPTQWPVEDVRVCKGALNLNCNGGRVIPNIFQHGEYLGPMNCQTFLPPHFINGVYFPDRIQKELTNILSGNDKEVTFGFDECFAPHA